MKTRNNGVFSKGFYQNLINNNKNLQDESDNRINVVKNKNKPHLFKQMINSINYIILLILLFQCWEFNLLDVH